MVSPIGEIKVEETIKSTEWTFYFEDMILGTTTDIEKWSTIVLSADEKKIVAWVDKKEGKITYKDFDT